MILFILYVVLSSSGLVLFKLGSNNISLTINKSLFSMNFPWLSLLGLLCYLISFILWMYIISKTNISFVVPLGVGLTNLAVLISSYFILHESLTTNTIVGSIFIILGIIIINIH